MNRFEMNRNKLIKDMAAGDLAIFFAGIAPASTADSLYPFRPNKNFYYLTGLKREDFILVIRKDEKEAMTTLLIVEPNEAIEKWVGRALTKDRCTQVSGIEDVQYINAFDGLVHRLMSKPSYKALWLDLSRVHHDRKGLYAYEYAKKIQEDYPHIQINNAHNLLSRYRCIKSEEDIQDMKKAIDLTKEGLEHVMKVLKPGIAEYVPSAAFDYSIVAGGADGNSFETIAASGDNATILHYIENDHIMEDGDLILMDLGAQYKEYAADITRTYPVNGRFSQRQKDLYNLVLEAHDAVIEIMKPGTDYSSLNKTCSDVLTKGLIKLGLIQDQDGLAQYYYHGVSHFLGLDTHDVGDRDLVLEPGMVLTVEPGLYIAEEHIGIRIEDDVLITNDGHEVLSADIIRTVEDIENYMKHIV